MATLSYAAEIDSGREFLESIKPNEIIVLLFSGSVDGIAGGAILYRTLAIKGDFLTFPEFLEKGETIYSDRLAKRILVRQPTRLIVIDAGSCRRQILPDIPTMVIDHHHPNGIPPVNTFVSSYGVDPPATASLLAYEICKDFVQINGREWLAALGLIADEGISVDSEIVHKVKNYYGEKVLRETIGLIDAACRAPEYDLPTAFEVLVTADNPKDIVEGAFSYTTILKKYRDEVNQELRRTVRTVPRISGRWALVSIQSPALVQPLIARIWARRLVDSIIIAANHGYTEESVHFSLHTSLKTDLVDELKKLHSIEPYIEYDSIFPNAVDGKLSKEEFKRFLQAIDFPLELAEI
jgi:single-stranded-DNA-specific exonuclease